MARQGHAQPSRGAAFATLKTSWRTRHDRRNELRRPVLGHQEAQRRASRPWRVRWAVAGRERDEYFRTKALADGFRNKLVKAARAGEAFDVGTGLPVSEVRAKNSPRWSDFARGYVEHMWEHTAPKTRRSMADALATVTAVLVTSDRGAPDAKVLRRALYGWAFNCSKRGATPPDDIDLALGWISSVSVTVAAMSDPAMIRAALGVCGRKQDGKPAGGHDVPS